MHKFTILGATGSIGNSTLSVIAENPDKYEVFALTANNNVDVMLALCVKWQPKFAALVDASAARELQIKLKDRGCATSVLSGVEGSIELASHDEVDTVMAAVVGAAGLAPTMAAVKAGKRVLLANKEALVMSGQLFIDAVEKNGAQLLPVDSEHNAIFQCLPANVQNQLGVCDLEQAGVNKILLTGSGGPFRYTDISELAYVTPEQAVAHPNWSMGQKISVDSATMMNKGLEYIEARWLFNASQSQIDVIIHPQSVIHSMVQYRDGSVLAQMGQPDMRQPIAHTMGYPERIQSGVTMLDFTSVGELTFIKPDYARYPCLKLAIDACFTGQAATTVLNAANEVAVAAFLKRQIGFMQISAINDSVLQMATLTEPSCLENLIEIDEQARCLARTHIKRLMQ